MLDKLIEDEIFEWFRNVRSMGLPVSNQLIITRAKFIVKNKNINTKCIFSNGWVKLFKKRYNIVDRKAGSKLIRNDDNKLDILTGFVKEVNEKIESNTYDAIINIDETGLYYDSKIEHTLDVKGTKRVEIISTGREKQRITVVLGVDLLNNIRMKPLIILKGKTKRCINNIPLDDSYKLSFQENAWCNEDQFIKFISLLPKNKKILLLYDNFGAHKTERNKLLVKWISKSWSKIDDKIISNSFEFCGYGIPNNVEPKWMKHYVAKK
jgi:hypothetical protein